MMTEIQTIEGGQKDALLRRANIKKKKKKLQAVINNFIGYFVVTFIKSNGYFL